MSGRWTLCSLAAVLLIGVAATASFAQHSPRGDGAAGPAGALDAARRDGAQASGRDTDPPTQPAADAVRRDGGQASGRDSDLRPPPHPGTGSKTNAADHGGIDLVRPDDGYGGYANLRRRAARGGPVTAGPAKPPGWSGVPGIASSLKIGAHPSPVTGPGRGVSPEVSRNAVGVASAAVADIGHHSPDTNSHSPLAGPGHFGTNPVTAPPFVHSAPSNVTSAGINGTNIGRVTASSIGGPPKNQSGINGTNMRPKY
jgi:hypothetical protein